MGVAVFAVYESRTADYAEYRGKIGALMRVQHLDAVRLLGRALPSIARVLALVTLFDRIGRIIFRIGVDAPAFNLRRINSGVLDVFDRFS